MNFNGTAGVWRKEAIREAGGWQADTLTEDLDLSYRAQLAGYKIKFLPEVVSPAEIPVNINSFKSQQHRWAKGSIQTAKKILPIIVRSNNSLRCKIQSFLHLTHYLVHPLMLILAALSLPLLLWIKFYTSIYLIIPLIILIAITTFGPPLLYALSQVAAYSDWKSRAIFIPVLVCIGTGIAVNNTIAVLEALLNIKTGFVRTPKYNIKTRNDSIKGKKYSNPLKMVFLLEIFMGGYCFYTFLHYLNFARFLVWPYLLIYTFGFLYVGIISVYHAYQERAA